MKLQTHTVTASIFHCGNEDNIALAAGQSLKIESTPDGAEVLNVACPDGKVWNARVIVEISETDA